MKKTIALLLAIIMISASLASFPALNAIGADESAVVIRDYLAQCLSVYSDEVVPIANGVGWTPDNASKVKSVYYETEGFIDGTGYDEVTVNGSTVEKNSLTFNIPEELSDLSGYNVLLIPVLFKDYADRAEITLTVYGENGQRAYSVSGFETDSWNGIAIDVSDLGGKNSVKRINIGIKISSSSWKRIEYQTYLGSVYAYRGHGIGELYKCSRFLSNEYNISGAGNSIEFDESLEKMYVNISSSRAEVSSVYSGKLAKGVTDNSQVLKIKLKNGAGINRVTFEYSTEAQQAFKQNPQQIVGVDIAKEIVQTIYVPLPKEEITEFKLSFDESADGTIEIYSISASSFYSSVSDTKHSFEGGITSCKIDADSSKIIIKGSVSEKGMSTFSGNFLQLYEIVPYMSPESVYNEDMRPIGSVFLSENFTFEISLFDGERSRINSSFAVVAYDSSNNQATFLSSVFYITNPEVISDVTFASDFSSLKKGFYGSVSDSFECCGEFTIVDFDISKFLFTEGNSRVFSHKEAEFGYNADYVKKTENLIRDYIASGSEVSLRLVYSDHSIGSAPFIIGNKEDFYRLEAIAEFIGSTFFSDASAGCSALIFGEGIMSPEAVSEGKMTLRYYSDRITKVIRIISSGVRSNGGRRDIYISLGTEWDGDYSNTEEYAFFSSDVADVIAEQINSEGSIPYGYLLTPQIGSDAVKDFSSLKDICGYLKGTRFQYDLSERNIILSDERLASEYSSDRDEFIDILAYQAMLLRADACTGVRYLMYALPDALAESRTVTDFIRNSGDYSNDYFFGALEHFGLGGWDEVYGEHRNILTIFHSENEAEKTVPSDLIGKVDYYSVYEEEMSFIHSSGVESYDVNIGYMGYNNVTRVSDNDGDDLYMYMKLPYGRSIAPAPVMCLSVYSTAETKGTVRFVLDGGKADYSFSLSVGKNDIVCDLTEFSDIFRINSICIMLKKPETIHFVGMSAGSRDFDESVIERKFKAEYDSRNSSSVAEGSDNLLLIIVSSVLALAVLLEALHIIVRRYRYKKLARSEKEVEISKKYTLE